MQETLRPAGYFEIECRNPDGSLAWRERLNNAWTTAGLNDLLNVYFASGTQKTAWYFGLIDASGFTSLNAADTAASHSGWSENTAYSGTRPAWSPAAASAGSMTSASPSSITTTGSATIQGAFLISQNTIGGTTGLLAATALFANPQVLVSGQVLSFTYTVPLTAT